MRFELDHPTDDKSKAAYGHDRALGFFVVAHRGNRVVGEYDGLQPSYDRERPLLGALRFFVAQGYYTDDELEDALVQLQHGKTLNQIKPAGVKRAAEVAENLKRAAG